jgi:hypothetical protein
MKAQMSLEILTYLAVAGIAAVASMHAYGTFSSSLGVADDRYSTLLIAEKINEAMESGVGNVRIAISGIPSGLCNLSVSGNAMHTAYGTFYLSAYAYAGKGTFCANHGNETVQVNNRYGYSQIERIQ